MKNTTMMMVAWFALTIAFLSGCMGRQDTLVCWDEPVRPPQVGSVVQDKWNPGRVQTICVPLRSRLAAQRGVAGAADGEVSSTTPASSAPAGAGTPPSPGTALTFRGESGEPEGTLALEGDRVAGTDRSGSGPITYVGKLDDVRTGAEIRTEVAGLGDSIRQEVDDALP